ncbi:ABC transporter permease [Inquilinus limosus]|uniref:ABC transmembrane type-1 domain-containing protein n=1 Tax=Inquilinus limosus TaxID=171674 RepID=A0A211ZVK2_9PROT|nr:ABC transporter permease [Inquilinus limosus]OWJ69186.1 hypothetical protein BWR60_01245 [Inquilinus limosus]
MTEDAALVGEKPRRRGYAEDGRPALLGRLGRRLRGVNVEGTIALVGLLVLWQIASANYPPMFFPPLQKIWATAVQTFETPSTLLSIGTTYLRITLSLIGSFFIASALGVGAALNRRIERFLVPLVELKQGIPAVCWIIFAILWFRDMETRIAFVVVTAALPSFFYQARDAVRSIPRDLWDMVRALRPNLLQVLRILVVPSTLPSLLTVWRVNIGNGTRVTIMAELLGGITGIGHQLRLSQELFRMDQVIVWTAALVAFVILGNLVLSAIERRVLRWRPRNETSHG